MLFRTTQEATRRTAKRECAVAAVACVYLSSSMHQGQPGTKFDSRPEINLDRRHGP